MAITDAEYQDWLAREGERRAVLVEAEYHDGTSSSTRYLASVPYISGPSDTPANQPYLDLIRSIPEIRSRIDGRNEVGRITLVNDGELDGWLTDAWAGWPLRVYLGDPAWSRDDYRLILDGVCDGLEVAGQSELGLRWRDRGRLLENPLQQSLDADDEPLPIALGSVFNCEPTVEDAANLIYRVHQDGNLTSVDAVRDSGVSVSYTDNGDGTFTLSNNPAGRISADVTGETTGTPQAIGEWIAAEAGVSSYDLSGLPSYTCGYYQKDETPAREALDTVMRSVGAVARWTRLGKLVAYQLDAPGTPTTTIDPDDIEERGLGVARMEPPKTRIRLGYERNFAVQDKGSLASSVSESDRARYGKEYRKATSDNAVSSEYPAATEDQLRGTLIAGSTDAQTEADRRATLRNTQRIVYKFAAFAAPFQISIGDTVTVDYPAYGFDGGKDAVVVGLRERPVDNRVEFEVWT